MAQKDAASLVGGVVDARGALVAQASVTAINGRHSIKRPQPRPVGSIDGGRNSKRTRRQRRWRFGFSASGSRSLDNNFLLDGIDNNSNLPDPLNEANYVVMPPPYALQEFKIEMATMMRSLAAGYVRKRTRLMNRRTLVARWDSDTQFTDNAVTTIDSICCQAALLTAVAVRKCKRAISKKQTPDEGHAFSCQAVPNRDG